MRSQRLVKLSAIFNGSTLKGADRHSSILCPAKTSAGEKFALLYGCCTSKRCTARFGVYRDRALSMPANPLRHGWTLEPEMPISQAMCAISLPQVWVRSTTSSVNCYYVEFFWTFCIICVQPLSEYILIFYYSTKLENLSYANEPFKSI